MSDVYKIIELAGTSKESYENAIENAIAQARKSLRNLGWFEVIEQRGRLEEPNTILYQVKLKVAFKLEK